MASRQPVMRHGLPAIVPRPPLGLTPQQRYANQINRAWQKSIDGILEAGQALLEAKAMLLHGEFEPMVETMLDFGPRTARMLMAIASHPELANRNHGSVLPRSWRSLYELSKAEPQVLQQYFAEGLIQPDMERSDVVQLLRGRAPGPFEVVDTFTDDSGETHMVTEIEELPEEHAVVLISDDVPEPVSVVIPKPDLGNGLSHPARFHDDVLEVCARFIDDGVGLCARVLDPFAGTGKIHDLRDVVKYPLVTVGVELEPEWANLHPDTIVGDALHLPFEDESFDAIVTSPCYGNRLADHHEAVDPELRRSYRHDLRRPLSPANSGRLQWGEEYRRFHAKAWREAVRVLSPGGRFILNIKDHIRNFERQPVSAWHVRALMRLGLVLIDCVPVSTGGLKQGTNAAARVDAELVWVLELP